MQYFRQEKDRLVCLLCSYYCKLKEGQTGICGVNKNIAFNLLFYFNYCICKDIWMIF
jgi:hypothetical protein